MLLSQIVCILKFRHCLNSRLSKCSEDERRLMGGGGGVGGGGTFFLHTLKRQTMKLNEKYMGLFLDYATYFCCN